LLLPTVRDGLRATKRHPSVEEIRPDKAM